MTIGHARAHAHDQATASGPGDRRRQQRRLTTTLVLALTYMGAEVVGGWWSGSLALMADAGHMASDSAALGLALFAVWVAARPAAAHRTFGNARAEVLAALAQGAALVGVAGIIILEAFERFGEPRDVMAPLMMGVAAGGLLVNLAGLALLNDDRNRSLNMHGAWLHLLGDALGSVGALLAGAAIWAFGWLWADPAVSVLIAALILVSSWQLLRDAIDVLMETAPRDLDLDAVRSAIEAEASVATVHDLHVWTIGQGAVALSCHVVIAAAASRDGVLIAVRGVLAERFGIDHSTVQVEPPASGDGEVECSTDCAPESAA